MKNIAPRTMRKQAYNPECGTLNKKITRFLHEIIGKMRGRGLLHNKRELKDITKCSAVVHHGFELRRFTYCGFFSINVQMAHRIARVSHLEFTQLHMENSNFHPRLGVHGCGELIIWIVARHFI